MTLEARLFRIAPGENLVEFRHQPYESRQITVAGGGECEPASRSDDQLHLQALFELRDAFGDRRRSHAQFACRSGEAAQSGDAHEGGDIEQYIDAALSD
jgi:hypothetical protein